MRHVVLVTTSYPDETPGSEAAGSFVADFAEQLSVSARVTVLSPGKASRRTRNNDVNVRYFSVPRLPLSLLNPLRPNDWLAVASTLRAGRIAMDALIHDDKPDHVLALWALPSGWWARSAGRSAGIPYSTWALGSDIWTLGRLPFARQLLRRVLADASNRYADGVGLCDDVERISGKPCVFLPSTRRLPRPAQDAVASCPPYKLAYLGRWHKNKGTDLLMRALDLLNDADWAQITEIRVFGGGPLEPEVRAGADRLTDNKRPITIGGYVDRIGAAELIGWSDYLLIPSRIESIPVVLSDAIQLSTPVIFTPVGDLPRLRGRFNLGIPASEATPEAIAAAIRIALRSDAGYFGPGLEQARHDFDISASANRVIKDMEPA